MSSEQRLAIFPTRMNLNNMKIKLKSAQKGHSLLKRKSDALGARFRRVLVNIKETKMNMGKSMKQASFSLAQVNYAAGDISHSVLEKVGRAQLKVTARMENVSGVQIPYFECVHEVTQESSTWLSRGGQQVQQCREAFQESLKALVDLAALQTSFFVLDETIKVTNRRVNALEFVMVPKCENTVKFITSELDEQDREDFFRLKKVQSVKNERERIQAELDVGEEKNFRSALTLASNILMEEDKDVFV